MLSTRERMEEHRENPACNSCHRVIDPLGLALENFDVTGAWRIKDNGVPVDSAASSTTARKMTGPAGLRAALLKHPDVFLRSFTENLMTYALGRRVEYYDMPTVRAIVRDAAKQRLPVLVVHPRHREQRRRSSMSAQTPTTDDAKRTDAADSGTRHHEERADACIITKKHLSRRTVLQGHGRDGGAAVPRRDGAGADACSRKAAPRGEGRGSSASRWCTARPAAPQFGVKKNLWAPAAVGRDFDLSPSEPARRSSRSATT